MKEKQSGANHTDAAGFSAGDASARGNAPAPEAEEVPERAWKSLLKTAVKVLIAAAIVLFMIHQTRDASGARFARMRTLNFYYLIPAALLYAFHIFANAWRWHLLLKVQRIPCSLMSAVSLTMQSFFFSLVMPGGALGGDVVRAGFIAKRVEKAKVFDGIFTILIDRFTGMIGLFSVAILMLPFTWPLIFPSGGDAPGIGKTFIFVLLGGSLAGIAAAFVVFNHHFLERFKVYRLFRDLSDRLSHGLFSKVSDALDSYREYRKELYICIAASFFGVNMVLALTMYLVCLSIDPSGTTSFAAALAAITVGNIAGLLPITPSGVGTRDYFVMTVLLSAGFQGDALLPAFVMTGLIIGFNLLGGFFFIFDKAPARRKRQTGNQ